MPCRLHRPACGGLFATLLLCGTTSFAQAQSATPNRASDPSAASQPTAAQTGRPTAAETEDPFAAPGIDPPISSDDPTTIAEDQDGLEPTPRIGQRPAIIDGDLAGPTEPLQPRDGIVDVGEPLPPEDGTDPIAIDTRDTEEAALFENPQTDVDPLLFQIEDLDPIRDNRAVTRLFRLEPYDPIGVRVGSFILFPEVELGGSYYSNVLRAPNASSDTALDLNPGARLVSNWNNHALEFRAEGTFSFFDEFDSENDKFYTLESRGRLDITRRTNVQALISRDQAQESRSALDANAAGTRADITTDRAEIALNHRFNRLSFQIRGSVADFAYGETENADVTTVNSDRDYTQYEQTVRGSWEFKPTLSVFTEVAVNQRDYDQSARTDLINRSSDGQRYRTGVSFGNTGQILRGEVALGYGVQTPDDDRLREIDGFILDANATWRASELTSVLFNARSDVTETTTANVGGSFNRAAGFEIRHALRRYLIASAGLTYSTQDSQDGIIDESELRAITGLEYFVNRETVLFGRYAHTSFNAIGATSDYEADEVKLGVRIRR